MYTDSSAAISSTFSLAQQTPDDFNGDGASDITWQDSNGDAGIWLSGSGVSFSPVDFGIADSAWRIAGVGDLNGDGKSDLLWRNSNGDVGYWLANAGTGYTGFTATVLQNVPTSWVNQGTADFTGTGQDDIVWRNSDGDTGVWLPSAQGGYTATDLGVIDSNWSIQGYGDFNGDGKAGILWRNAVTGQVGEWLSNAGSGFTGFTPTVLQSVDSSWSIQGVGSFDGTAQSGILWRNTSGDVGLWLPSSQGGYTAQIVGTASPTDWTIQGVYDFNGDGKADILWREANGTVGEWISNPGAGFTGFTAQTLIAASSDWSVVGNNPSLGAPSGSAVRMAQAMAAMHGGGPGLAASMASTPPASVTMIASPAAHVRIA